MHYIIFFSYKKKVNLTGKITIMNYGNQKNWPTLPTSAELIFDKHCGTSKRILPQLARA